MKRSPAWTLGATLLVAGCTRLPAPDVEPASASCRGGPPLTWIQPDEAAQRAALAPWCATIGPVLFEASPARPPGAVDSVAVVTWNVHVGAGNVDALIGRLRLGELTDGVSIEHFVLLLQEAYRQDQALPALARTARTPHRIAGDERSRSPDVRRLAAAQGLSILYVPAMRNGRAAPAEDRGNAIASTLPLEHPVVVELPLAHQRRVAAVATIAGTRADGTPWRLRVASAHFDTAPLAAEGPFEARRRQADALVEALTDTDPTIVAGDFNAWLGDREPAIATLRRAFPLAVDDRRAPTWRGPLWIHATLDRVFARGPLAPMRVVRVGDRFGSDHHPLVAVVRF